MTEKGQTTKTTINLKSEFSGARDHKARGADGAWHAPDTRTASDNSETDDFSLSNSDRHLLHAAVAAENGGATGFILPSPQQSEQSAAVGENSKRKRDERHQLHLTFLEQARQLSERLARQIAAMEAAFEADMGDAWREQITNRIMEPNDIPERRPGESMKDYRERLETVLIVTMIDPTTGRVKPEYANNDDPDIQRYAEWAQAQHQKREADVYIAKRGDPSLTDEQRAKLDAEVANSSIGNEMRQIQAGLAEAGVHSEAYQDRDNRDYDRVASSSDAEADAFSI